ncbi:hypothetical protein PNOK_0485200 [Pyrrhoderma noxium]|uniref:Uncharacterized protein n=1 Tax=Pyrrhoderma noxium TaxID=2282107 RepID=A0A286UK27_9AGAM|nr:hypothetical protein PNOK_0485200 [Pyrrhoderma noxium]
MPVFKEPPPETEDDLSPPPIPKFVEPPPETEDSPSPKAASPAPNTEDEEEPKNVVVAPPTPTTPAHVARPYALDPLVVDQAVPQAHQSHLRNEL